ncbi:Thiamine pyrophosphate-requiring enzyme [Rubrobacter radiotolerans]|uniref:Thiamine pyrophosphate-binding protein n=1 Tax=Rubrobacter radiotolerans TaxID=42256 RepID=A0A023X779_RUBRA|nr:thiamine pyrophosphate-binding protein [Rubrobacter radiotolerans]AHY47895.1 Thiamine pyrophosphate-requiring enzyme [Rubrobacter radiotolerans]MDX5892534.1 thiamine pyrophosphate-binding protein [Rubrobacter radiotolerans]SMC07825.1 acetolactate synthase-1/2/3 large subunit [Rubrobacter radiotolerans DSM 5868]
MEARTPSKTGSRTGARLVAEFLARRGVRRIYGLCGGHIQPIWDEAARAGIRVVDVRHECAAVYMAHAEADLTGSLGVAMVTAGPGLTNAITGIANASVARSPVLVVSGRPPRPQAGMGALQDIPQGDLIRPICRRVETVYESHHILPRLETAIRAAEGVGTPSGPAYVDFPTDLLRADIPDAEVDELFFEPSFREKLSPSKEAIQQAASIIREARRPLVISGKGARAGARELSAFLEASGALYLDTAESRGAVPLDHPASVPASRAKVMAEADVIVTVARKLDFQLAYGSRAVFSEDAKFVRLGANADELFDNRRGDAELLGDVAASLKALTEAGAAPERPDTEWIQSLKAYDREKSEKFTARMGRQPAGSDGYMHPSTLLAAVNEFIDEETIVVADGGDILSFARGGLRAETYLDPGPLGCLGVGVPFANSAALNFPEQRVVAVIGDGSFGLTAMEVDTAVRHNAQAVFVVANNESWAIERNDQLVGYGGNLVGVDLPGCRYDKLAEGLGAYAERVEKAEDLPGALQRAFENAPALLDVAVTPEAESPDFKNGLAWVPDRQALEAWDQAEKRRYAMNGEQSQA